MDANVEESICESVEADLSSSEDVADGVSGGLAANTAAESDCYVDDRKINNNFEHNKKERERRKVLKEAVTQLREQLRKPTRKPVTIKVLEAAQNEIKELKELEESSTKRLELLKKKESHLQWKIEELKKELSKLPISDSLDSSALPDSSPVHTCENDDSNALSQQPTAACLPPPAPSVPHTFILASLPQAPPTPATLMNFPLAPTINSAPPTLFQPGLTAAFPQHAAFLQAFPLQQAMTATPPHINHQTTSHLAPRHSLTSSNSIRPHLLSLPPCQLPTPNPIALGVDSYMMPAHTLLPSQLLGAPPTLTTRFPGLISQRNFPLLRSSDHQCPSNPIGMPFTGNSRKESNTFTPTQLGTTMQLTAGIEHLQNHNIISGVQNYHQLQHAPTGITLAGARARSDDLDGQLEQQTTVTHQKPIDSTETSGNEEKQRNHVQAPKASLDSPVEVGTLDDAEENDNRENASVSSRHSLPDDDQTDVSDNYSWGRKKKRKKKRKREECQSSSDSESEGSCSSSRRIRLGGEKLRYSSSCSSNGSSEQSKRNKGDKTNSKKCPTLGNTFSGVPPLLKVTAAEFHWPITGDGHDNNDCRSLELISECEITVSANASYSPSKQELQSPPCPTLKHLTLPSESNDSSNTSSGSAASESPNSQSSSSSSSSSTGEEADLGWTEAIIERSMNNLKKKFEELQSPCLDLSSSYRHSGETICPVLLT